MKNKLCRFCFIGLSMCVLLVGCGQGGKDTTEEKKIEGIEALTTERPKLTTEHETEDDSFIDDFLAEELTTESFKEQEVLTDLKNRLSGLVTDAENTGMEVSVYVEKVSDSSYASFSNKQMLSAGLIKMFVAGCAYEHMEDITGGGVPQGDVVAMISSVITASDDEATNKLVRLLGNGREEKGLQAVNDYCSAHGFDATAMGRLMNEEEPEKENYTSVNDCSRFLKLVYKGELPGSDKLLAYLKQHQVRNRIPSVISSGTVANMTGALSGIENDAAIVIRGEDAYTICVMTNGLSNSSAGKTFIVNVALEVNKYMNEN